ncbi:MAG: hypothetical protein K2N71_02880, partial [Oscillospiraceae bacterium]|nr:hypothetical protein [Oscillospiraceae bacterium]
MMCRKIIAAGLALSVLTLSGCSFNSAEGNEQVSEIVSAAAVAAVSQRAEAESTSEVTTSVTSETVIFCDESVFSEITETEPPYIEDGKPPVVMSVEELYDTYPVKLIYPERQDVSDKVKTEILQEDIYNSDGFLIV